MTSREVLGWRIPQSERDLFVRFVEEKWGSTDSYVRFEIESAMREFLDKDDLLCEAEQLLRDYLQSQGLSSSPPTISDERADHSDTVQLGYRINSELKDEFAAFAKQHYNDNLGAILARALNAYRDGGRRRRVLEKIHQLVTGGIATDTTTGADENTDHTGRSDESLSGGSAESAGPDENSIASQSQFDQHRDTTARSNESATVDGMVVSEIAGKLETQFTRKDLIRTIAKTLDGNQETIELYSEAVTSYENVVEHPANDGLFIPRTDREEITVYGDLDRKERAEKLRTLITMEALNRRTQVYDATYTDVQDLFDKELCTAPSHDYAYTLMGDAAEKSGFSFKKRNSQKKLRVDIDSVHRKVIEEAADHPDVEFEVSVESSEKDPGSPDEPENIENPACVQ